MDNIDSNESQTVANPIFTQPIFGEEITSTDTNNTYRIGSLLGSGSFGDVYECTDSWDNELAVKVLKPLGTYEEIREKAIEESQKLKLLRHPNVTFVYDAFEYRHTFYIVFERCWQSINELMKNSNFDGGLWLKAIARQLLQAVHFLHCNKYVHQDIHGGNVFIAAYKSDMSPKDTVFTFMLGDLGITKMVADMDAENTILAEWIRAPESINIAEFGPMDHRMDIYHCGLLFLQIVKGQQLSFTIEEILDGAPRKMALELGHPYSEALEKALRRHVEFRTATALEFWQDLKYLP